MTVFTPYLWQGSTIPTYQKINAFMESAKPSVYTSGNSAGIDRVRKEDGLYAFFMEAAAIEYHVERKCDLKQLGGLLDSKGYGIALPKGRYFKYSTTPRMSYHHRRFIKRRFCPRRLKHKHTVHSDYLVRDEIQFIGNI